MFGQAAIKITKKSQRNFGMANLQTRGKDFVLVIPSSRVLSSGDVLLQPVHEELGNFRAIFFGHELVAVPGYPRIFEPHERGLDSGLIEPLGYAVGVRAVITRFTGHIENRDAL